MKVYGKNIMADFLFILQFSMMQGIQFAHWQKGITIKSERIPPRGQMAQLVISTHYITLVQNNTYYWTYLFDMATKPPARGWYP